MPTDKLVAVSLITDSDKSLLEKAIKILEQADTTSEDYADYENWDMIESVRKAIKNLTYASQYFTKLPEDEKHWYDAHCNNCHWWGSSEYCDGGHAIADTGDYSDPLCPVCGSNNIS